MLAEIASITQGESANTDNLDEIIQKISVLPEPQPAELRTRLWSNSWWGGTILLFLVIYWTGRKLAGLIRPYGQASTDARYHSFSPVGEGDETG